MKLKSIALLVAATLSFSAHAADVANGSFELNNITSNSTKGYLYSTLQTNTSNFLGNAAVSSAGWVFTGGSGISKDNSAWGGNTPNGEYFAFLQGGGGTISQNFTISSAADYSFSFDLIQRTNHRIGGLQTVSVKLDGNSVWSGTPGTTSWTTFSGALQNIGAGAHTLSFVGTNLNGGADTSAFLDNVKMTVTPVPEPESYAMFLAGLGLMGAIARRKKLSA
jgi:hypothetical protein